MEMDAEAVKEQQAKLHKSLSDALKQVRNAEKSDYWGYVREFELGQLAAASSILAAVVKSLKPFTLKRGGQR